MKLRLSILLSIILTASSLTPSEKFDDSDEAVVTIKGGFTITSIKNKVETRLYQGTSMLYTGQALKNPIFDILVEDMEELKPPVPTLNTPINGVKNKKKKNKFKQTLSSFIKPANEVTLQQGSKESGEIPKKAMFNPEEYPIEMIEFLNSEDKNGLKITIPFTNIFDLVLSELDPTSCQLNIYLIHKNIKKGIEHDLLILTLNFAFNKEQFVKYVKEVSQSIHNNNVDAYVKLHKIAFTLAENYKIISERVRNIGGRNEIDFDQVLSAHETLKIKLQKLDEEFNIYTELFAEYDGFLDGMIERTMNNNYGDYGERDDLRNFAQYIAGLGNEDSTTHLSKFVIYYAEAKAARTAYTPLDKFLTATKIKNLHNTIINGIRSAQDFYNVKGNRLDIPLINSPMKPTINKLIMLINDKPGSKLEPINILE
jgi:hypothetical protein